jgi:hypothetical protein
MFTTSQTIKLKQLTQSTKQNITMAPWRSANLGGNGAKDTEAMKVFRLSGPIIGCYQRNVYDNKGHLTDATIV